MKFPAIRWEWVWHGIELSGLILALIAIGFAVKQYHDAAEQNGALKKVKTDTETALSHLEDVGNDARQAVLSASTRALPTFPSSMQEIEQVVRNTCADIDIMTDVTGYGKFSDPDTFERYYVAIEEVKQTHLQERKKTSSCLGTTMLRKPDSEKIQVRLLVYSPEKLRDIYRDQFAEGRLRELLQTPGFTEYFAIHKNLPRPKNSQELFQIVNNQNLQYARHLNAQGVDVRVSNNSFPLFVWMHDAEEAAFVFNYRDRSGQAKEIPFRTRDPHLTRAFKEIFDREWDRGKDIDTLGMTQ